MSQKTIAAHVASVVAFVSAIIAAIHPGFSLPSSTAATATAVLIAAAGAIQTVVAFFHGKAKFVSLTTIPVDVAATAPKRKPLNSYWSTVAQWAEWIAVQLTLGSSYPLSVTTVAVGQYLAGETVTDPEQAQNLWSMIFSTGTIDPRYVPPLHPVPEVKGAKPNVVAELAAALAKLAADEKKVLVDQANVDKLKIETGLANPPSPPAAV